MTKPLVSVSDSPTGATPTVIVELVVAVLAAEVNAVHTISDVATAISLCVANTDSKDVTLPCKSVEYSLGVVETTVPDARF